MSQAWLTKTLVKSDSTSKLTKVSVDYVVVLEMVSTKSLEFVMWFLDCPTRGCRREARSLAML